MKDNERQEIEKFGQLQENGIFTMTIIGEIEGHQLSAQNAKTTKYEHMIPALAKVEQDESIKGILILINTIGGDVECGLAIAELIASLSKPTSATGSLTALRLFLLPYFCRLAISNPIHRLALSNSLVNRFFICYT